jgi:hypothetical protein
MMRGTVNPLEEEEFRTDEVVRLAALIMDPLHGKPVRAGVTAAQLIEIAERQHKATVRRRWWVGSPVLAALVVFAILAAAKLLPAGQQAPQPLSSPGPGTSSSDAHSKLAPLRLPIVANPPPAHDTLVALSRRTGSLPGTGPTGSYLYLRTMTWSLDVTSTDPERQAAVRDEQLWRAADRSGRKVVTDLSGPPAAIDFADPKPATAGPPVATSYPAGKLTVRIENPQADPALLASQLHDFQDFRAGPQAVLRSVVDLYKEHSLSSDQRAAAIRVLADTTGLVYRGLVLDRKGRPGIAISVDTDNGNLREVAVFDEATGQLLSYEQVALLEQPAPGVRPPAVIAFVLYLAAGYTDSLSKTNNIN